MSKINLVSSTPNQANTATTALTGKENVMSDSISTPAVTNDNECPCMGNDEHCHRCSTWETPIVCKGCGHVEWFEGMDDFCRSCQADGTEHTLRLSLSDKVDAQCKRGTLHISYSEDEWNEFK